MPIRRPSWRWLPRALALGGLLAGIAGVDAAGQPETAAAMPGPAARAQTTAPSPTAARQADLVRLVRQDCGSCHGMRLLGGLGPALTADALAGKPVASLAATILHGRPGTAMPGWQALLDGDEALWIATHLAQGTVAELPNGAMR